MATKSKLIEWIHFQNKRGFIATTAKPNIYNEVNKPQTGILEHMGLTESSKTDKAVENLEKSSEIYVFFCSILSN